MKALIVDGRPEMLELLGDFARLKRMTWASATDGYTALLILAKANMSGRKFDLVVISRETARAPLDRFIGLAQIIEKEIKFLVLTTTPDFPEVVLEIAKLGRGVAAAHEPINFRDFETLVDGLGIATSAEAGAPKKLPDLFASSVPLGERTH